MLKKLTCIIVTAFLFIGGAFALKEPEIDAKAAILAEATTGEILYELNADKRLYPASTTKLMTAIVAMENGDPNGMVTVNKTALTGLTELGGTVYLIPGEKMPFLDMMDYLLIHSGNDGANVLAENVAGSVEKFVSLMNQKAKDLGCTNTHYTNAHGLHDENHYTSARDLLKIAECAMKNPVIAQIVGTEKVMLAATNKHPELQLTTTNYLISKIKNGSYKYEGAIGIKTGFTTPAGYCLIGGAKSGDYTYYSVILGAEQEGDGLKGRYTFTADLFNYAIKNFSMQKMVNDTDPICEVNVRLGKDKESVILKPKSSFTAYLANDFAKKDVEVKYKVKDDIVAPIEPGAVLGSATFSYKGRDYATIDLVASEKVERSAVLYAIDRTTAFLSSAAFKIIAGGILLIVIVFTAYVITVNRRRNKRRSNYRHRGKYKK